MLFLMDYKTLALLAIVTGLVIICMGLWYVWNTQQMLGTEVRYLRNQHISMQEKLKTHPGEGLVASPASPPNVPTQTGYETTNTSPVSTTTTTTTTPATNAAAGGCEVSHRSYHQMDGTAGTAGDDPEESSSSEEDDTDDSDGDEAYDDDDQHVETSDLVNPNPPNMLHHAAAAAEDATSAEPGDEPPPQSTQEDTNHLVESILSNIVSETVEQHCASPDNGNNESVEDTADDGSSTIEEDFLETSGNYEALADSLRKKTVVELKKMCAEYQIGIKKGKTFLKKEELIDELVVKMPVG